MAKEDVDAIVGDIKANLVYDKRKDGWKLLEHTPCRINSMDGLELVPVMREGEDRVSGEEMVRRARAELDANFGQEDAEWLLENQSLIPKEWRGHCVSFPATILQDQDHDSGGDCHIPYLDWDGVEWYLGFGWLGHGWDLGDHLLHFRK